MLGRIEEYMGFIENDIVSGYFYAHNNGYEVMFKNGGPWSIRLINQGDWDVFSKETAVNEFNKRGLDLLNLELKLRKTILDKVAYCDVVIQRIEDMMGKKAVEQTREGWANFRNSLREIIEKNMKKNKFKVVKDVQ